MDRVEPGLTTPGVLSGLLLGPCPRTPREVFLVRLFIDFHDHRSALAFMIRPDVLTVRE